MRSAENHALEAMGLKLCQKSGLDIQLLAMIVYKYIFDTLTEKYIKSGVAVYR